MAGSTPDPPLEGVSLYFLIFRYRLFERRDRVPYWWTFRHHHILKIKTECYELKSYYHYRGGVTGRTRKVSYTHNSYILHTKVIFLNIYLIWKLYVFLNSLLSIQKFSNSLHRNVIYIKNWWVLGTRLFSWEERVYI